MKLPEIRRRLAEAGVTLEPGVLSNDQVTTVANLLRDLAAEANKEPARMRDIPDMKRIDEIMRKRRAVITVDDHITPHVYSLMGETLRPQIVRDMINDGWLVELGAVIVRKQ